MNQASSDLECALADFKAASPELLEQRSLLQRVDTKYVLNEARFTRLLSMLTEKYFIVHSEQQAVASYTNIYFDTHDFACLRAHHRGERPRYKVRIRHHRSRRLSFLEVKKKNASDKTLKQRCVIPFLQDQLNGFEVFVAEHSPFIVRDLEPSIGNSFGRITLIGRDCPERITFDINLSFTRQGQQRSFSGVIVEVKQPRFSPRSAVMLALKALRVRPMSVSKYCVASSMLLPHIKLNLYRPKLRQLRSLVS